MFSNLENEKILKAGDKKAANTYSPPHCLVVDFSKGTYMSEDSNV